MDEKLALVLAFLRVQSRHTHLLAQVSSLVVLHTPISKVLGNSHSVVACSCGALLAVATKLLSQQEASPPPPQVSSPNSRFCSNPTTQRSSNSSHLIGEDKGDWNLLLQKKNP